MMRVNTSQNLKALSAAVLCASVAMASQTQAQQTDKRLRTLEEVIVTARKVEESLQDTPVSVAAFSEYELQQIGVSEAGDVARFTPSLEMRKQTASDDRYAIAIRGVFTGDAVLTADTAVGIYQDGVYIARLAGTAFDIVDLERIEVLRGPQGTLFGRNTIGGAINIVSKKPSGEFGAKLMAGFGQRDRERYQATIDTSQFGDFAAKLSYLHTSQEGSLNSTFDGETLGDSEAEAFRLALRWTPGEDIIADYVYNKSDRESNAGRRQISLVRPLQIAAGGPYFQAIADQASTSRLSNLPIPETGNDALLNSDIDSHALTAEWRVSDQLSIKSISSYREWESAAPSTNFGSFPSDGATLFDLTGRYSGTGFPGIVPTGTLVPVFGAQRESSQRQLSQEFQFTGNLFDGRVDYIAGLFYFEEKGRESNPQEFVVPDFGGNVLGFGTAFVAEAPFFDYATDNTSYAAYGQFSYAMNQDLDITLGLRYTVDDKAATLTRPLDGTLKTVDADDDWTHFDPSLTVTYRWNEQINTYAKVATGYLAGGYNARASSEAGFRNPTDEETVTSYELGIKADLLDRTLRLNTAVFYMDYQDRQISQFVAGSGGAETNIVNAGESTTSGLELEAVWLPVTGLKVIASYGYLNLKYDEFITTQVDPQTGLTVGSTNVDIADSAAENLYTPEHSGSLALEYQFAPWDFGQLTLRIDATHTDDMGYHPQLDLVQADSQTLVNARATLADIPAGNAGRVQVAAWVKNLADEDYIEFVTDFGQLGSVATKWGEPRIWGVDFTYHFNR